MNSDRKARDRLGYRLQTTTVKFEVPFFPNECIQEQLPTFYHTVIISHSNETLIVVNNSDGCSRHRKDKHCQYLNNVEMYNYMPSRISYVRILHFTILTIAAKRGRMAKRRKESRRPLLSMVIYLVVHTVKRVYVMVFVTFMLL